MQRTNQGELLSDVILQIFQLNGELLDAGNKLTKPFGLTSSRWQVLGAIEMFGQPMSVAQIARRMGLSRQAVQRTVNELNKLGLVDLQPNIDHKRSPLIELTSEGSKVMKGINQAQAKWVNELSASISEKSLKQVLNTLKKISEQLAQVNNK